MSTAQRLLSVKGLTAWYPRGQPVLDVDELTIPNNTIVGLLGANGSGKTTLINCLSGVHEQCRVEEVRHADRLAGFTDRTFQSARYTVFTEHAGFRYWTFTAYLTFLAKTYARRVEADLTERLIDGFVFGQFRDKTIGSLSTGNKKKAFLIAGLALRLPLLILDEPVDGLDFEGTEFLYTAINEYREHGSVFMSSHIAESFERCCDQLYLLRAGALRGPVDDEASLRDVRGLLERQ